MKLVSLEMMFSVTENIWNIGNLMAKYKSVKTDPNIYARVGTLLKKKQGIKGQKWKILKYLEQYVCKPKEQGNWKLKNVRLKKLLESFVKKYSPDKCPTH